MSFLQKTLASVNAAILSSKQSLGLKLKLQPEKNIFLFTTRDATKEWIASSDRSIGGLSECQWGFYDPVHKNEDEHGKKGYITRVNQPDEYPSAVFSGRLSMECAPTEAGIVRSGYCGVRASVPTGLLLHGYEGITMRVMTDGREYRMNVQMDSWNPLNLYMGFIRAPANEWVDIELPFRDFLLTAKGYVKLDDETPLDSAKLRSIGFAIADQKEGDFELRIQWIKAIAQVDKPTSDTEDEDDSRIDNRVTKEGFRKPSDLAI